MYLTIFNRPEVCSFTWFSSPGSWHTWFHSRKICIDVIWPNFYYLADDEAPILNCPNISSTTDEGLNSSSTVLLSSTATDNVDFDLDVNCSHSSQDIFLIGDTTVNCSSSDAAGNTETCLLVVTVTGVNLFILCVLNFFVPSGFRLWDI